VAPEFFGCFLAVALLAVCAILAILVVSLRGTKAASVAMFALMSIGSGVLFLAIHLGKQFLLNEPMAIAACQGNLEDVRRLLDRGASPDSWGVDCSETALTGAAGAGHADIVQLLIDRGANPNLPDSYGKSALSRARALGHKEIEEALLKAGAKK
jgi:hypothetical protein